VRLQRAVELIRENLDAEFSVDVIARGAGVSASGLQRLFRLSEGLSVFEYVRQQRLERAYLLLKSNAVSIQEASSMAGYSNPANFATAFADASDCLLGMSCERHMVSNSTRRRAR
jgi:AraC-like DNA-binding protein